MERRLDGDRATAGHDGEVQALSDDRARLAGELDEVFARASLLERPIATSPFALIRPSRRSASVLEPQLQR